jgi:transposase
MECYAGIDVSLKGSSICVVDATGKIVRETRVPSEPEALVAFFRQLGLPMTRIGLEAGPLSQWLIWGVARQASLDLLHSHTRDPDGGREAGLVARGRDQCRGGARSLPRDRPAASTHIRSDP